MRSSSESINIAASAQKIDIDNRISLRFYYRIADNILKQADIFRGEKNIIDLYIMLLRFSSLVSETIPSHRDYRASPQSNKNFLKKRLLNAVIELEELKPAVKQKINELNRKDIYHDNNWNYNTRTGITPPHAKQDLNNHGLTKTTQPFGKKFVNHAPSTQQHSYTKRPEEEFRHFSLNIHPKEETLSKHSILGPNGLHGQWQPPISGKGVQYPSNIDLTPVEILRENILQDPVEDRLSNKKESISSEPQKSSAEPILSSDNDNQTQIAEEPNSLISFEPIETPLQTQIVRQPSPPPVLADVQDLIPKTSPPVIEAECGMGNPTSDGLICSETPLQLHISTTLMDSFMRLAKSNTEKNLETCGVLAGSLKNRKFYITALIIPKQESTSDSCQTTNEEEIFEVQDKQSLLALGWIHTHPTQPCFMSSIDVHTHYSYQIMLPEAIAIVVAPRDSSRKHGIFRLTNPGGMAVIRQCPHRGFHAHEPPSDGSPIYKQCTDVYMNPDLKFDVIDLR